jgi:RNA polymerase sigma-70 factor (ECF subfamily)
MVRPSQGSGAERGSDGRTTLSLRGFAAFYEAHYRDVLNWFLRRTRNGAQAVDLTAETFAKAFEGRERFRGSTEREALGWVYSIALTELLQLYRRGKVETKALERLKLYRPPATEDEARRVEELIDADASKTPLAEALDELSPHQQKVFERHVLDERSPAEIAKELGCTEVAVRMSLHRARRRLKNNPRVRSIVEDDN